MSGLNPGKYVGEWEVPTTLNATEAALEFIASYGSIDGAHHKAWVLDQVARILHGTPVLTKEKHWHQHQETFYETGEPSEAYLAWVKEMRGKWDPEWEEFEYDYDEGIAP